MSLSPISSSATMAREMVDRLADPLLSGVYGGESANLSVRAVLPRFAEMERTHGSLGRAMLAARKKMSPALASLRLLFHIAEEWNAVARRNDSLPASPDFF